MPRDGFSIEIKGLKELQRSLDRFAREAERRFAGTVSIPIDLDLDDEGYLDRACPAPECRSAFKVLMEDYRNIVRDEAAYCVVCRHEAEAQEFHTPSQADYVSRVALGYAASQLAESARIARLDFRPHAEPIALTPQATDVLLQRTTCTECGCRYATLGSSFFCHACGHHAAMDTFRATMATIRSTMEFTERDDLGVDRDTTADIRRQMAEMSLGRAVNAFEAYAAERYSSLAPAGTKARKNAFQNLERSDKLWRSAIGKGYADMLTADEHADLALLIQRRHLSHRGGMVDQEYLDNTGDTAYRVGQRMVISADHVRRLIGLYQKIVPQLGRDPRTPPRTRSGGDAT